MADDPRLSDAKAKPIKDVAHSLGLTYLNRGYPEIHGPCPACGGSDKRGSDRFWIDLRKNCFACRKCNVGGDTVALVQLVQGCSFPAALDWLCGPKSEVSEAERKRRAAKAEADQKARDRDAQRYRDAAVAAARGIWRGSILGAGTMAEAYLMRRGIDVARLGGMPDCIRFHIALPYTVPVSAGQWRTVMTGPAMVALIRGPDGRGAGVHRTWLDMDQPKGKARIVDPETGEVLESKKVLGSKKGGAIRLTGARARDVMIMGEGIETTYSAWMADPEAAAMFWVGVDKGNMAGRKQLGKGLRYAGLPDLDDAEAFLPPVGVTRLVYVMDGDSEPRGTRADMEAGLRRAMVLRPGLRGQIAPAPAGFDLNDVLMGAMPA